MIPTLDEEQSIADTVRSIPRGIVSRVIVADGGSRDATAARARAAGADVIDAGRGYGRTCLAATMAAEDADIVVFMDGVGAADPGGIANLVEPIRSGRYDFVIGSRSRGKRRRVHHRDLRPLCERNKPIAARTRSPARAFEGAMINSASSVHRHNVICFVR